MGLTFDTLLTSSGDEPDSAYGLIAESVEVPKDRTWVQFNLRKEARFHDGTPITPEDVIWTFDTLKEKGHPRYRIYYARCTEGGEGRRARRALHLPQRRQSRAAADRRPAAGAVEEILGRTRFREDDARTAARQRPLQGRYGRSGPLHHLSARRRLLGEGSAGQSRALQFRQ